VLININWTIEEIWSEGRRMMKTLIFLIVIITSTTLCYAESNQNMLIKKGFFTGNLFRTAGDNVKIGYAMGFIDGVYIAPVLDAPRKSLQWIEKCINGMTNEQVVAIINKFLDDNPARWHEPMNILAYEAMKKTCEK
jgi:hypothetical protein